MCPVYDYECSHCGHTHEEILSVGEMESGINPSCPMCGSCTGQSKRIGSPNFVIHGYSAANGYASKNRFGTGESEAGEQII